MYKKAPAPSANGVGRHVDIDDPSTIPMKAEHWKLYQNVYNASSREEQLEMYAAWSSVYEESQADNKWQAPKMCADLLYRHLNDWSGFGNAKSKDVLDFACGTGLVGLELQKLFAQDDEDWKLYGLDQSLEMMSIARKKNVYEKLFHQSVEDLSRGPVRQDHGTGFAAVICVGSINPGHIEPKYMLDMIQLVERKGFLVASLRFVMWDSVKNIVEQGESEGRWQTVEKYVTRKAVADDDHCHICLQRL